ncbi:aminoglycoside adenylyltransferase domain-containing protein [Paenibacillus sp. OV219]|uniref:aminoglycoside adenylyltransferase domain-containing protein n=1 Tax=Paenibacillus sp. OV219 TaxID=1884377 RepID=UPI0008D23AFB|nr:aminoglycoside adenylyltransferase domain-containing protein [Paenibacillus sp. OV219]SEN36174.1 streptomycin 3-adenylyltransferase [Paenibacillus sp. OV219]
MDTHLFLERMADRFKLVLGENVAGIYLHGSLAMGGFNPDKSDIDIIILAKKKLSKAETTELTKQLLLLHEELPSGRGIELSVVLEAIAADFVHPAPFEYHYSDSHRERYQTDEDYMCGGFEDPDLAAHFTIIYERGVTIYGKPIQEVFKPIDRACYVQSIVSDIASAAGEIVDSPVYYTLNLCRVLLYLREGLVSSKKEAGEWALHTLPHEFNAIIATCLDEYIGLAKGFRLAEIELLAFAEYMLIEINQHSVQGYPSVV